MLSDSVINYINIESALARGRIATHGKDGVYLLKYDDAINFKAHVAAGGDPLNITGFEMLAEHESATMSPLQFADYVIAKRGQWKLKIGAIEALAAKAKLQAVKDGTVNISTSVAAIIDLIRAV